MSGYPSLVLKPREYRLLKAETKYCRTTFSCSPLRSSLHLRNKCCAECLPVFKRNDVSNGELQQRNRCWRGERRGRSLQSIEQQQGVPTIVSPTLRWWCRSRSRWPLFPARSAEEIRQSRRDKRCLEASCVKEKVIKHLREAGLQIGHNRAAAACRQIPAGRRS